MIRLKALEDGSKALAAKSKALEADCKALKAENQVLKQKLLVVNKRNDSLLNENKGLNAKVKDQLTSLV